MILVFFFFLNCLPNTKSEQNSTASEGRKNVRVRCENNHPPYNKIYRATGSGKLFELKTIKASPRDLNPGDGFTLSL